ncbi:MAG: chemotaxis protein CheW [Candidatus Zixiibacteriota bacterium]|nr:MAG: chemotaxis protein CheW [candidate division Zixibacteria bacterium]
MMAEDRAGKYLTFKLAAEEYGLEILRVREIIGLMDITEVPQTPYYIRGIINLRGSVIPVMDLRLKFGMETTADTDQTCVIVVEINSGDKSIATGLVVDSVSEVLDIAGDQIEDSPSFGSDIDTDYILGIGKIGEMVKILLNIDKVLDDDKTIIKGITKKKKEKAE